MILDKLENDEAATVPGSDPGDSNNNAKESETFANTANAKTNTSNEQKARDRLESRKKLEALLNAYLNNSSSGALRIPRWRLESEAERDDVSPFELQDAEAMEPLQIFRSVVLAVMYTLHLRKLLMAKKMAEKKESATRDFEAMLHVYFDATRMWLAKVVRTPLLSLLQDSTVDVDISTRNGLAGSSLRGFAKKFSDILARRPPPPTPQPGDSGVDHVKLLKLKVRMRGVLQALGKAIDKKEVPSGILDFLKRISTDGVYFPPSYQLFDDERRRMPSTLPEEWILMELSLLIQMTANSVRRWFSLELSWNVGIGPKNVGKQASANLASLATLLLRLQVAFTVATTSRVCNLGRRRSKTVATSPQQNTSHELGKPDNDPREPNALLNGIDPALVEAEPLEQERNNIETSFLSIEEIGRRLLSDKNFPIQDAEVIQVVNEHEVVLQETLMSLRFQLRGS